MVCKDNLESRREKKMMCINERCNRMQYDGFVEAFTLTTWRIDRRRIGARCIFLLQISFFPSRFSSVCRTNVGHHAVVNCFLLCCRLFI